jgi:hypothetical protein
MRRARQTAAPRFARAFSTTRPQDTLALLSARSKAANIQDSVSKAAEPELEGACQAQIDGVPSGAVSAQPSFLETLEAAPALTPEPSTSSGFGTAPAPRPERSDDVTAMLCAHPHFRALHAGDGSKWALIRLPSATQLPQRPSTSAAITRCRSARSETLQQYIAHASGAMPGARDGGGAGTGSHSTASATGTAMVIRDRHSGAAAKQPARELAARHDGERTSARKAACLQGAMPAPAAAHASGSPNARAAACAAAAVQALLPHDQTGQLVLGQRAIRPCTAPASMLSAPLMRAAAPGELLPAGGLDDPFGPWGCQETQQDRQDAEAASPKALETDTSPRVGVQSDADNASQVQPDTSPVQRGAGVRSAHALSPRSRGGRARTRAGRGVAAVRCLPAHLECGEDEEEAAGWGAANPDSTDAAKRAAHPQAMAPPAPSSQTRQSVVPSATSQARTGSARAREAAPSVMCNAAIMDQLSGRAPPSDASSAAGPARDAEDGPLLRRFHRRSDGAMQPACAGFAELGRRNPLDLEPLLPALSTLQAGLADATCSHQAHGAGAASARADVPGRQSPGGRGRPPLSTPAVASSSAAAGSALRSGGCSREASDREDVRPPSRTTLAVDLASVPVSDGKVQGRALSAIRRNSIDQGPAAERHSSGTFSASGFYQVHDLAVGPAAAVQRLSLVPDAAGDAAEPDVSPWEHAHTRLRSPALPAASDATARNPAAAWLPAAPCCGASHRNATANIWQGTHSRWAERLAPYYSGSALNMGLPMSFGLSRSRGPTFA